MSAAAPSDEQQRRAAVDTALAALFAAPPSSSSSSSGSISPTAAASAHEQLLHSVSLLKKLLHNIVLHPRDTHFRHVRLDAPLVQQRVLQQRGALAFLRAIGFVEPDTAFLQQQTAAVRDLLLSSPHLALPSGDRANADVAAALAMLEHAEVQLRGGGEQRPQQQQQQQRPQHDVSEEYREEYEVLRRHRRTSDPERRDILRKIEQAKKTRHSPEWREDHAV